MTRLSLGLVPALLLATAAGGCGTSAATATPTATPTLSPSLETFPPGPTTPVAVTLQGSYRMYSISSEGPLAVLSDGSGVVLVDLSKRSSRTLAQAASGYTAWDPIIRGDSVAWVEWRDCGPSVSGLCTWRVVALSLRTGESRELASGTNKVNDGGAGFGASPPLLALDRTELAYASMSPSASQPWVYQIRVVSLATGQISRTIDTETDLGLECLALSSGVVAYTERTTDESDPRLMLSTPEQPAPRQLAPRVDYLSFRDGRIAWVAQTANPPATQLFTATADWQPIPITDGSAGVSVPAASKSGVSYAQSGPDFDLDIWTWDAASGLSRLVSEAQDASLSDNGSGWLIYASFAEDSAVVAGMAWPQP